MIVSLPEILVFHTPVLDIAWNLPGPLCCSQFLLLTQGVSEGLAAAFLCLDAVSMDLCLSGICLG